MWHHMVKGNRIKQHISLPLIMQINLICFMAEFIQFALLQWYWKPINQQNPHGRQSGIIQCSLLSTHQTFWKYFSTWGVPYVEVQTKPIFCYWTTFKWLNSQARHQFQQRFPMTHTIPCLQVCYEEIFYCWNSFLHQNQC